MSFKDIKFQGKAIEFLQGSIESGRLSHSLLFFGPEAIGKRHTAVMLAKALNCEVKGPLDSCDSCLSCRKIDSLNHPDVTCIGPEGSGNKIKIDKIRAMKRNIFLKPFEGKVKFFIIESSHLMNDEAANSILKTLEEPPKDSVIILITDDIGKIFPTLKSRCQWVSFSQARPDEIKVFLLKKYNLEERFTHFLSHLSGGKIGKAISMKKEGSLEWKNRIVDRFSKENVIFGEDPLFFNNKREKILGLLEIILSWYRDIFILKNGADTSLLINIDRKEDLKSKAESMSKNKIMDILNEVLIACFYIKHNVNPKLALSNLMARID